MTEQPNILCVILSREPSTRDVVKDALTAAMREAERSGIRCEYTKCNEPYGVVMGRNRTVATFVKGDWTHLLFVDDDVVLPPHAITALVRCYADVAAGCYVFMRPDGNRIVPSLAVKSGGHWAPAWFEGRHEVDAAATGCMLIRREVFDALGFPWFQWPMWLNEDGHFESISDDIDFCRRAKAAGFSVVADGEIRCGHIKPVDIASTLPGRFNVPQSHYASHVPMLKAIAGSFPIRTVREFGAGLHSTPLFLNAEYFPDVESVISHEQRDDWIHRVQAVCRDERLTMMRTPMEAMPDWASAARVDLAFIDCDDSPTDDYSTRAKLLDACRECGIVVVHDAERMAEQIEHAGYRYCAVDRPEGKPHTAVLSNVHDVSVLMEEVA